MTRLALAVSLVLSVTVPAHAASYAGLKSKGYKTGSLIRRGISRGWIVSKGGTRYFCKQRRLKQGWKNSVARSLGQPKVNQVGSCRKLR